MTAKLLENFGGKVTEQWAVRLLTPAFVFWLGGVGAAAQRWGWAEVVAQVTRLAEQPQLVLLVAGLCVVAASAAVVQRFDLATLRFLEGYGRLWWHPIWQCRVQHYRNYKASLRQQSNDLRKLETQQRTRLTTLQTRIDTEGAPHFSGQERAEFLQLRQSLLSSPGQQRLVQLGQQIRELPVADGDLMPTRLGNLLRAAERQSLQKYGLDAVICWSRLWMLLPDAVKQDLQTSRADLNAAARLWLWSLLFCGWVGVSVNLAAPLLVNLVALWPLLGLVSAGFAYQWAIAAARTYGDLIEAAFDLYRHLLYDALRWTLPPEPHIEKQVGRELTRYLWRGPEDP
ncbi:MAG: hypothetical protein KME20_09700 [Kaiparowitsia implicata GSE-PSE-MK54-09C]|jgi:hypothetical protein|nr:hypothetical protein [Kaiparowitsia implicata GSE-PSE-MK54-09C]